MSRLSSSIARLMMAGGASFGSLSLNKAQVSWSASHPPGVHAFTPAASQRGDWIAVATRRLNCEYHHVEIFRLESKEFMKLTELVNPNTHHYNPFVFSDSDCVGYHRCRENLDPTKVNGYNDEKETVPSVNTLIPYLEPVLLPLPQVSLIRVDGAFPAFSPDGSMIVFIKAVFQPGLPEEKNLSVTLLTKPGTKNNAFPAISPDGKYIVFRSGCSGHKNLWIMDAEEGEEKYLRHLTDGEWTDTMPNWSPDNEWVAFSSDREQQGDSFAVYYIHPDRTGLHKVLESEGGGRVNHPWFSPDSKSIVFTSDEAGVSAEPISVPNQFQPYGDLFSSKADGTEVQHLTHNAYEDGTTARGCAFIPHMIFLEKGRS
ncbi:unnamed protein product [Sphagnum compactum]